MPLSGMLISRIEDGENLKNAFEISGQSPVSFLLSSFIESRCERQDHITMIFVSSHWMPTSFQAELGFGQCDLCLPLCAFIHLFVCFVVQVASVSGCRWRATVSRIYKTGWTFSPNTHTLQPHTDTRTGLSLSVTQ